MLRALMVPFGFRADVYILLLPICFCMTFLTLIRSCICSNMSNVSDDISSVPLHRRTNGQVQFGKHLSMFTDFQSLFVIHEIDPTCYHFGGSPSFVALVGKFYLVWMFPLNLGFFRVFFSFYIHGVSRFR